jgi:hypothetical protein
MTEHLTEPPTEQHAFEPALPTGGILADSTLRQELQRGLRLLDDPALAASPLNELLLVRAIAAAHELLPGQALRRWLLDALDLLGESNAEGALILRRHYADAAEVYKIAKELNQVEGTINRKQRLAIAQLAEIVRARELAARRAKLQRVQARLEAPTYTRLFGVAGQVAQLAAPLATEGPPWLLAIDGAGGIGKTALADYLVRTQGLAARWDEAAWVTARQQVFNAGGALRAVSTPALTPVALFDALYAQLLAAPATPAPPYQERERQVRAALRTRPHLVVVDNLESAADLTALVELLAELAGPSKFLLTTRHSLHQAPGVFSLRAPELSPEDAIALLRWEAQVRNLPLLGAAPDDQLAEVYAVTGGNPLALRLVAGQTYAHALPVVLHGLRAAEGRAAEALYTHIYRHAWERLDERGRAVMVLMPLASESGAELDFLAAMSGLPPSTLQDALEQLVTLNLVDSRGTLQARRYSIHSLTRTFLLQQVVKW